MIPLVDLKWQTDQIQTKVLARFRGLLKKSAFILGGPVGEFETEYSSFLGVDHCIGVANGTDALEIALRALELPQGSEVLVPANSFIASALAVLRAGLAVRFVSVNEVTQLAHAEHFADALTKRTRVIMPVHLYGQCAPMSEIMKLAQEMDLFVVEDCAQSQGATQDGKSAGTFGHISATSFYPGKNLGAWGDGGAVLTNDADLARRAEKLRNYGSTEKYIHGSLGFNSRLDSLQAVVLSEKLKLLPGWNEQRRSIAKKYDSIFEPKPHVKMVEKLEHNQHVYHLYVVRLANRDEVLARLNVEGVSSGIHYPRIIPDQLAFRSHPDFRSSRFVNERRTANELLSLPMYPGMSNSVQRKIVRTLEQIA